VKLKVGYKIVKNSEGKLVVIKETPEEQKVRLSSVQAPAFIPILHEVAATVRPIREYAENDPEMRGYEKFIPAAQLGNIIGKMAKRILLGTPEETDKLIAINKKVMNNEPLTEEEKKLSMNTNMMAVMDMATPTTTPSGASGLDDIARAQNIKNAGKDLTAMIQGVRNTAKEASNEFRYHTTSKKALENIKDEGLKPARGQYGKGVYFAPSEKMTGGYGSPDEVMIRINKNKLPTSYDEFDDQGWVNEIVPPKYLEYKEKGSDVWKPLVENKVGGIDEVLKSKLKPISNIGGEINEGKNQIRYISPDGTPYSLRKVGGGVMGAHAMELDRMNLDANEAMEKGLLRALVTENKQTGVKSLLIENKIDLNPKQIETIKKYFPDYEIVIEKTKLGGGTNSVPIGDAIVIDKGINIKDILNRYNKEAERIK